VLGTDNLRRGRGSRQSRVQFLNSRLSFKVHLQFYMRFQFAKEETSWTLNILTRMKTKTRRRPLRELELWIFIAFVMIVAWSVFGLFVFSHSYMMFLPLNESLQYDDAGSTFMGAMLIVISLAYAAAALFRLASTIWAFGGRIRRKAGAATSWM
jgi:hypothetical protein